MNEETGREVCEFIYEKVNDKLHEQFEFRDIKSEEIREASDIEQICFPPNEACKPERIKERVEAAPDYFLVAFDRKNGRIAGFFNGIATNEYDFRDEFFLDAGLHDPNGKNIMMLGLDVLPEYRKKGLGRELVYEYCRREQKRGSGRLVLTCLENKVDMYKKFGFRDLGEANSSWGGESWHEMDISLT